MAQTQLRRRRPVPDDVGADDIFTREDLSDEQRLFGQTAAEFMRNEVLPQRGAAVRARLGLSRASCCEGGRARSAAARDSRRRTAASASTRSAPRTSASRLPSTRRSPDRSARTRPSARCRSSTSAPTRRRRKYLPRLASGELIAAYALTEPQSGSDALAAQDHRDAHRRRPPLPAERPEDVDHQRRLRRSVHHLREGRRREVHRVPRRARHGRRQRHRTRRSSGSTDRPRPR